MECQDVFEKLSTKHFITTKENCANYNVPQRMELRKLKKAGQAVIASKYEEQTSSRAINLEVQGHLAILLDKAKINMAWHSVIFSVPRGVMAFAARAATNSQSRQSGSLEENCTATMPSVHNYPMYSWPPT